MRLDQAHAKSAALPGDLGQIQGALVRLIDLIMQAIRRGARGDALAGELGIRLEEQDGLFDIRLSNAGNLDQPLPEQLTLAVAQCDGFDGLGGYAAQLRDGQLRLTRQQSGRLAAGASRAVGWARCTKIDQGAAHVRP